MTGLTHEKCITRTSRYPPGGQLWQSSGPSKEPGPTSSFLTKLSSGLELQGCLVGLSRGPVEQGNPYTGAFTREGEDAATRMPPADLGRRPGPPEAQMERGPQVGCPLQRQGSSRTLTTQPKQPARWLSWSHQARGPCHWPCVSLSRWEARATWMRHDSLLMGHPWGSGSQAGWGAACRRAGAASWVSPGSGRLS